MSKNKDKELTEIQKHVKELKKLYGLLIKKYIALLESDQELKASMVSEIASFLNQNGITLGNMVNLEILENLKSMDSELKGELTKEEEVNNEEYASLLDFEPFDPAKEGFLSEDRENLQ